MSRSIAAVLLAGALTVTLTGCGGSDKPKSAGGVGTAATSASTGPVTFQGLTVTNPTDLGSKPKVSASGTTPPTKLEYKDLVVGTGTAASPTATVNVQYDGLIYQSGKEFQASWDAGGPITFSLQGVVPGFTQGIGGTTGVPPMKVGGRRIMILPPALGYPNGTPDGSIPPNTPIVFIVDLVSVG